MSILSAAISGLSVLAQSLVESPICQLGLFSLITWRLWRFTISPALYPEDPREVPYWIPWHIGFVADFNSAAAHAIKRNRNKEPFAITFAGQTLYIISDPNDAAEISRKSTSVSRDLLTQEIYKRLGITQAVADRLFTTEPDASASAWDSNNNNNNNPRTLNPTEAMMEMYRVHLSPGPRLDAFLEADIIPRIQAAFKPDSLQQVSGASLSGSAGDVVISLHDLCVKALVEGVVRAYYGDLLFHLYPGLIPQYMIWEKVNWKFVFGLPHFLSRDMLAAQHGLVNAFTRYFAVPAGKRGHDNFWVDAVERLLRHLEIISNEDIGRLFMLQTWAILGNMFKTAFWVVSCILDDPTLVEAITKEIQPAIVLMGPDDVRIDHHYLVSEKCPKLDSLFGEVMRLTMTSPMARDVVSTTTIGGRRLRQGKRVLNDDQILYRQLHLDPTTWGPTPETLQPERFLQDSTLRSNIAYRPWGAGKNACPGRFLAKNAVFTFIACLFGQFDVRQCAAGGGHVVDHATTGDGDKGASSSMGKALTRADLSKPTPGIASVADGKDVLLQLRRRRRS